MKFSFTPSFPYSEALLSNSGFPRWIWSFANFDGVHYLTIAKSGYWAQYTQVFFPLYPLMIKLFSTVFPFVNLILSGLLIANFSYIIALIYFTKLLNMDYTEKTVNWVILFLIFFPVSFFFGSLYTESFFLLLLIGSFYAARTKKWWLAGILGSMAGATRLVGIFLLPALIWEWQEQHKLKISNKNSKLAGFFYSISHSPALYLVPTGLLTYMLYLGLAFHDPLYFWHAQPVFGAQRSGTGIILLPQVIFRYLKILLTVSMKQYDFWTALSELSFTLSAIILMITAHIKKIRMSYLIFSWLTILVPTLSGTLSSMPRYILVAFPIFMVLGMINSKPMKIALLASSLLLLVTFTLIFTRGIWVS